MTGSSAENSAFSALTATKTSGGIAPVHDAATGEIIGTIAVADEHDVAHAAEAAAAAQPAWAATSFRERAAVLIRAAVSLRALDADTLRLMQREEGAIAAKITIEISKAVEELHAAAGLLDNPIGELLPDENPAALSMAQRVPVGVVGVISPWNAPLLLAMRSLAPALALGNAVVLKPDAKTAISGGAVILHAFAEAGLPEGVLQLVVGGPPPVRPWCALPTST